MMCMMNYIYFKCDNKLVNSLNDFFVGLKKNIGKAGETRWRKAIGAKPSGMPASCLWSEFFLPSLLEYPVISRD